MFERFRRGQGDPAERDQTAPEKEHVSRPAARTAAAGDPESVAAGRDRQRRAYGGVNWGAAFFGWLVAVGVGVILTALLAAAGTAIGLTEVGVAEAAQAAETVGLAGAIALIAVALVAYFAGGYVAGRMSRFDGGRQGLAVWAVSVLVAIAFALAGVIGGAEYNVFGGLDLPRIPIDEGALTTGGAIALVTILLASLLAGMGGGKAGEGYHRRVDRAALTDDGRSYERPGARERILQGRRFRREDETGTEAERERLAGERR